MLLSKPCLLQVTTSNPVHFQSIQCCPSSVFAGRNNFSLGTRLKRCCVIFDWSWGNTNFKTPWLHQTLPSLTQVPIISCWWYRRIYHCPTWCSQGLKMSVQVETQLITTGNTLSCPTFLVWKCSRNGLQTFNLESSLQLLTCSYTAHYGQLGRAPLSPLKEITLLPVDVIYPGGHINPVACHPSACLNRQETYETIFLTGIYVQKYGGSYKTPHTCASKSLIPYYSISYIETGGLNSSVLQYRTIFYMPAKCSFNLLVF